MNMTSSLQFAELSALHVCMHIKILFTHVKYCIRIFNMWTVKEVKIVIIFTMTGKRLLIASKYEQLYAHAVCCHFNSRVHQT